MVLTRGKGMVKRNMSVLLRLFPIVPLVLLIVTLALTVSARNKLKNCGECTGTILRMEKFTSASGSTLDGESTIAPVVEYEVDGQRYEFVGRYASSSMKAGDRVQVTVSPDLKYTVEIRKIEKGADDESLDISSY